MQLTSAFDIVFATGVCVAALALAGAAMRFLPRRALIALASLEFGAAIGAWLFFALRHSHPRELAVSAGGLTGCVLAAGAAIALRRAVVQGEQTDAHLEEAKPACARSSSERPRTAPPSSSARSPARVPTRCPCSSRKNASSPRIIAASSRSVSAP
jgi:hypothetical protein